MANFNHILESVTMNFVSKAGSRTRIRVPVAGTRFVSGIKPGDKVKVHRENNNYVSLMKTANTGRRQKNVYTVEKDGAIRIPALKYNLRTKDAVVACDNVAEAIYID